MIKIIFLEIDLELSVPDALSEAQMRLWAAIKSVALKQGQIPRLPHEEAVLEVEDAAFKFDTEIFSDARQARQVAHEMCLSQAQGSLCDMTSCLQKEQKMLEQLDPTFALELGYMAKASSAIKNAVHKKLQSCMPTADAAKTMAETLAAMQDVQSSRLGELCTAEGKNTMVAAIQVISSMINGQAPDPKVAKANVFWARLHAHCQFFCRYQPKHSNIIQGCGPQRSHWPGCFREAFGGNGGFARR